MIKLTDAQKRVLALLDEQPLNDMALTVYRVRVSVLLKLRDHGLARYRPYGKPPSWAITQEGRQLARGSH